MFEIEGRMPANLRILRFETLEQDLHRALEPFCRKLYPLPHLNSSVYEPYARFLSPEIEDVICRKYRWVFDRGYYPRELNPPK
jgi:hypothetical protein